MAVILQRLKISLHDLGEERRVFRFLVEADRFSRGERDAAGLAWSHSPVEVSGELTATTGAKILEGRIETTLHLTCCRCLEAAEEKVKASFRYLLLAEEANATGKEELTADDLDTIYCSGEELDLEPLVHEQILLQFPMKPLCRPDCRGLCPRCGENLNGGHCRCLPLKENNPFAVLKNFKIESKI